MSRSSEANIDTAIINIGHDSLSVYKLVIVPADYVMDAASAKALRDYVSGGGTVLMTAFSAKVDEHGQWFETPLPGRLSDVFGLRTAAFYTPGEAPRIVETWGAGRTKGSKRFYEVVEPDTAKTLARFSNMPDAPPAITVNPLSAKDRLFIWRRQHSARSLKQYCAHSMDQLGIQVGPKTPEGVYARVVNGRTLYVNTTDEVKDVVLGGKAHGILSHQSYEGAMKLGPYQVDLLE